MSKINKESYGYYKTLFRANYKYYESKGYQTPYMMTKEEWEAKKHFTKSNNKEIIYNEFHKYTKSEVKALESQFKSQNIKTNLRKLARGDFSDEQWESIKATYTELRKVEGSVAAKEDLGYLYWGS